jgi:hypothetical protein
MFSKRAFELRSLPLETQQWLANDELFVAVGKKYKNKK